LDRELVNDQQETAYELGNIIANTHTGVVQRRLVDQMVKVVSSEVSVHQVLGKPLAPRHSEPFTHEEIECPYWAAEDQQTGEVFGGGVESICVHILEA